VLDGAVEVVAQSMRAKSIDLERRIEPDLWVWGDEERLQQVVWNLLSNAVKFTPVGGRISLRAQDVDGKIEIAVSDSGQGIDPAFLPHVFDRFRQEDSSSRRQHKGLGLGLAIVRHLVERHGGTVSVASEGLGKGARFTVQLPAAAAALEAVSVPRHPESLPDLSGLRALVVDDEPDSREVLAAILQKGGAEVRVAESAADARRIFGDWNPSVIVCDIEMPTEDGYAMIRALRAEGIRIPAVAVTAYSDSESRVRALEAGFQLHLPKPVTDAELRVVVASATRSSIA
jgi:CheY-like chemotaxis protein/anti-sigma regulatory factor (Ser/Thr protein kinase)